MNYAPCAEPEDGEKKTDQRLLMRWLGTAGFEFSVKGRALLIDPYIRRNPRAVPRHTLKPHDLAHADVILLTHGHFDHAQDVPEIAALSGAVVLASESTCKTMARKGVPRDQLHPLREGEAYRWGPFLAIPHRSRHVSYDPKLVAKTFLRCLPEIPSMIRAGILGYPAGDVFGWMLEVGGLRVFHLGSAALMSPPGDQVDLFLVPIQGRSDICDVALQLLERVKPRLAIPHHHDDFFPPLSQTVELREFVDGARRALPEIRVHLPIMGEYFCPSDLLSS